jgi:3-oxoacyl-[acyl-carrier protein] reductase
VDLGLEGCAAIVGGASSGMGRAIAGELAAEGCSVTVFARRADALEDAVREINARCGAERALAVAGSSSDPDALARVVQVTTERFGRIDIVVNNTGGPPAGDFADFEDGQWEDAFHLTVMSAVRLTRLALPALRASGRGRVVNITSSAVKEPVDGLLLSNALRPGIIGWAKHLSREEGPSGITVNSIAPGYIDTDRLKYLYSLAADPEGTRRSDEASIPAKRFGAPEEIAAAVTFLCSTRAAYINGITLLVDGGLARGLLS